MSLSEQISADIKTAMKARDQEKLAALRDIKSKLMLEATKGGDGSVDEETELKVLNKLYKQRMETAELYATQDREDLRADELNQAAVIKEYLPEQLDEAAVRAIVKEIIDQTGASSMADMGKVMGMASQKTAGRADGKLISQIVKETLG
jgi:uncharacterized protein YqeY